MFKSTAPFSSVLLWVFPQLKKEKIWLSIFTCPRNLITGFHWAFLQAGHGKSSERPQWDGKKKTCHATQKQSLESKKGIRCDSCLLHLMVSMMSKHTHECKRGVSAGHRYRHIYVTKAFMLKKSNTFFRAVRHVEISVNPQSLKRDQIDLSVM